MLNIKFPDGSIKQFDFSNIRAFLWGNIKKWTKEVNRIEINYIIIHRPQVLYSVNTYFQSPCAVYVFQGPKIYVGNTKMFVKNTNKQ